MDEETPPFAFVLIEGTASISEDAGELVYWARQIAGRYMGKDLAEDYGKRNGVPGELVVRVQPEKIIARKDIAD